MIKQLLYIVLFLLICYQGFSQSTIKTEIDSLLNTNLSKKNSELPIKNFNAALEKSINIAWIEGIVKSRIKLAELHLNLNDYSKALQNYLKAYNKATDQYQKGLCMKGIGIVNYYKSNFDTALTSYHKAIKYLKNTNHPEEIIKVYNNIGVLFERLNRYDKAVEYYLKVISTATKIKDDNALAAAYNNLGNCYFYQKDYTNTLNYFNKSLKVKQKSKNLEGIANTYNNIGAVYNDQGDYPKALSYFFKAQNIEETNNLEQNLIGTYYNIGYAYWYQKKYKKAEETFKKGMKVADKLGLISELSNFLFALHETALKQNNYKKAYNYLTRHLEYEKIMLNEEKYKQITEIETKYKLEQRENEILLYEAEIHRQNLYIWIGVFGILLLIALLLNLNIRIKHKKRINKALYEKNTEIKVKSKRVEEQRDKIANQNKEITDSIQYAGLIQSSLLPEINNIKEHLPETFVLFKPRDIVSGDFFWFYKKHNKNIIAAVDCTGHGVPGALMSMLGISFLNEIVNQIQYDSINAAELLNRLREKVISTMQSKKQFSLKDGMDMSICVIENKHDKHTVEYSGANNSLFIVSENSNFNYALANKQTTIETKSLYEIKADKMYIGYSEKREKPYTNHKFTCYPNDRIFLFSDGFADQFGGENKKKLKSKGFKEIITKTSIENIDKQEDALDNFIEKWKNGIEQIDDILIIGIKF